MLIHFYDSVDYCYIYGRTRLQQNLLFYLGFGWHTAWWRWCAILTSVLQCSCNRRWFFSWNQVSIAWSTASKYCPLSSKQTKNNWRIHILKQVPLEDISSSVCSGHSLLCGLRNDDKDVLGYERTYKSSRNCYENSLYSIRSSLSSKRYFVISIHHFFMRTIP